MAVVAGWVQAQQQEALEYLRAENRILKAQLHGRRLRLTDDERRRLAVLGKRLGRRLLTQLRRIEAAARQLVDERGPRHPVLITFSGPRPSA